MANISYSTEYMRNLDNWVYRITGNITESELKSYDAKVTLSGPDSQKGFDLQKVSTEKHSVLLRIANIHSSTECIRN